MPTDDRRRRRSATALGYTPGRDGAPKVLAAGAGHVAEKIIAAAQEAGIPVREDPVLAQALATLDVGDDIPADLYVAIAEALIWAWQIDNKPVATPGR
jgi:flagellar biosynthesis protein